MRPDELGTTDGGSATSLNNILLYQRQKKRVDRPSGVTDVSDVSDVSDLYILKFLVLKYSEHTPLKWLGTVF